ncbi:MAG: alpha/beta fold hydrolase [Sphingobacteriales bacterium]|nr:MAG: alpha/beta fold hydrolase [Sphingobacteriales bacterium]
MFMRYSAIILLFLVFASTAIAQPFVGFKQVNGTQLYCKVIGEGEPLLIVHGGPSMNHDYLLPQLEPLAAKYKLIFYDQRASGRSPIPPDSNRDISYRIMVDDIEALRNAFGIKKLNILAHSWGAKLAVNYALQYPEYVGKLIFVSPITFSHEYDSIQIATIASRTTEMDKDARKKLVGSPGFMKGDMNVYEQVLLLMYKTSFYDTANLRKLNIVLNDDFYHTNAVLSRGLLTDQDRYDRNYYHSLKKIKAPLLIIQGAVDNIPIAAGERLKASVANGKLVVFDKSGHFPFIEEQDKFLKEVAAFMDAK